MRLFLQTLLGAAALVTFAAISTAQEPDDAPAAETGEDAAATADVDAQRAPDEYEASEQISEDLSVSFPVDI